jgi:hypothetical protein
MYQLISITLASLFPVAAIVYSLNYGMSNKKRIKLIDRKLQKVSNLGETTQERTSSISSLLDYAEKLGCDEDMRTDSDEEIEDIKGGGSSGELMLSKNNKNLRLQATNEKPRVLIKTSFRSNSNYLDSRVSTYSHQTSVSINSDADPALALSAVRVPI